MLNNCKYCNEPLSRYMGQYQQCSDECGSINRARIKREEASNNKLKQLIKNARVNYLKLNSSKQAYKEAIKLMKNEKVY